MNQKHSNQHQAGFTIVELMIAMGFIAFLLLAIAATVIQIGAIYNKGVTMKSVNQAGRAVVTDMKRTIGESEPFVVATSYKPHNIGTAIEPDYSGGRLCTGVYSYIWNIGTHIDPDTNKADFQFNKYAGPDDNKKPIRLIKVRDGDQKYCKDESSAITFSDATELLSEENLAVQAFHIERGTDNLASGEALYSIAVTISNADSKAIDTVNNRCAPPTADAAAIENGAGLLQNFCAVNEFSFTARAGNKGD